MPILSGVSPSARTMNGDPNCRTPAAAAPLTKLRRLTLLENAGVVIVSSHLAPQAFHWPV
jgi:hypothetical protein